VLGYRDKVHNFEVFNDHALSLNPLCYLVDSQGNVRTYYSPCGHLIPKKSAFLLSSCLLVLLRGRRRKIAQDGIVRNTVPQHPIHVCLQLCVIEYRLKAKNMEIPLTKMMWVNNMYLKCEIIIFKPISRLNMFDMKSIIKKRCFVKSFMLSLTTKLPNKDFWLLDSEVPVHDMKTIDLSL
jgi:hypothetical protein